jgi:hypothetical protein
MESIKRNSLKCLKVVCIKVRGILTSAYKQEIKMNMRLEKSKLISKIKSMILNHEGKIKSQTEVIPKVLLFAFAIILIAF